MQNSGEEDLSGTEINPDEAIQTILQLAQQLRGSSQQPGRSASMRTTRHVRQIGIEVHRRSGLSDSNSSFTEIRHVDLEVRELKNQLIQSMIETSRDIRQLRSDKDREVAELKTTVSEINIENEKLRREVMKLNDHSVRCDRENAELKLKVHDMEKQVSVLQNENDLFRRDIATMIDEKILKAMEEYEGRR